MWISLKNRKRGFLLVRSQNFHQTPPWSWVRLLHLLASVVLKLRDSDRKTLPFVSVMYIWAQKCIWWWIHIRGRLLNQKTSLSSTINWAEALGRFCIAVGGVVAAVSVFVRLKQLKNYKYWDGNAVYLTHVQRGVWGKFCDLTRRNPLLRLLREILMKTACGVVKTWVTKQN